MLKPDITTPSTDGSPQLIQKMLAQAKVIRKAGYGYAYARNNGLLYTDPDGLRFKVCYTQVGCSSISDLDFANAKNTTGYIYKDGKIYDDVTNDDGTVTRELRGTYQRTSFDDWDDRQNAIFFGNKDTAGLVDRAPAAGNLALATAGTSYLVGGAIGGGLYLTGAAGYRYLAQRLATSLTTRGDIARQIGKEQTKLLHKLFGSGEKGARQALANPQVSPNLTTESLIMYREIARRTIVEKIAPASQAVRIQIVDKILLQRGVILPK